jgi:hypothetical protein
VVVNNSQGIRSKGTKNKERKKERKKEKKKKER